MTDEITLLPEGTYSGKIIDATEPKQSVSTAWLFYFHWLVEIEGRETPIFVTQSGSLDSLLFIYRRREKFIGDAVTVKVRHRNTLGSIHLDTYFKD